MFVFSDIITTPANISILQGVLTSRFKLTQITPLLKKPGFDKHAPSDYRSISNLLKIPKILEHLLLKHIKDSIFSNLHIKSTTPLTLLSSFLLTTYTLCRSWFNKTSSFSWLRCSIQYHNLLRPRLQSSFVISDTALSWFTSYLSSCNQFVNTQSAKSTVIKYNIGVPQGSVHRYML